MAQIFVPAKHLLNKFWFRLQAKQTNTPSFKTEEIDVGACRNNLAGWQGRTSADNNGSGETAAHLRKWPLSPWYIRPDLSPPCRQEEPSQCTCRAAASCSQRLGCCFTTVRYETEPRRQVPNYISTPCKGKCSTWCVRPQPTSHRVRAELFGCESLESCWCGSKAGRKTGKGRPCFPGSHDPEKRRKFCPCCFAKLKTRFAPPPPAGGGCGPLPDQTPDHPILTQHAHTREGCQSGRDTRLPHSSRCLLQEVAICRRCLDIFPTHTDPCFPHLRTSNGLRGPNRQQLWQFAAHCSALN